NHDILMERVAERVADKRVLKIIRAFLNAGVMEDGLVRPVDEGTPQGGPLSHALRRKAAEIQFHPCARGQRSTRRQEPPGPVNPRRKSHSWLRVRRLLHS